MAGYVEDTYSTNYCGHFPKSSKPSCDWSPPTEPRAGFFGLEIEKGARGTPIYWFKKVAVAVLRTPRLGRRAWHFGRPHEAYFGNSIRVQCMAWQGKGRSREKRQAVSS
jgi:hypothetical protein